MLLSNVWLNQNFFSLVLFLCWYSVVSVQCFISFVFCYFKLRIMLGWFFASLLFCLFSCLLLYHFVKCVLLNFILWTYCFIKFCFDAFPGTVPIKSLMSVGRKWSNGNNNGKLFEEIGFSQRTHSGILKDQEYIQQVMSYLNQLFFEIYLLLKIYLNKFL